MINFFDHIFSHNDSKSDKVAITIFSLLGGYWGSDFLFWMDSIEHAIKALMFGGVSAILVVVNHMVLKYYKDNWEDKFEKFYKKKKDGKEKDNQRAA